MLTAIVAFFSPAGFLLPQQHLAATLAWLKREHVRTVVAQVVREGQEPQPVPAGMASIVYSSQDALFYKENLYNLAAGAAKSDSLLFLDADVQFSVDRIFKAAESLLETYDIIQPFDTAAWLSRDGHADFLRHAAALALSSGLEPWPGTYHPGFSWAMTRDAFDRLGGWFDQHPLGGGDTAFAYSLDKRWAGTSLRRVFPGDEPFWASQSYRRYQDRASSMGLRVGVLQGVTAYHRWHGSVINRQYCQRAAAFEPHEYRLHYRPDGLLAWDSPEDSERAARYFASRKEDG